MKTLVITPENKHDLEFLKVLMQKLGYPVRELSDDEIEDLGLLRAMGKEKNEDYVREEEIRKALK